MNTQIESKRLADLFNAILDSIPDAERATITERIAIVSDAPGSARRTVNAEAVQLTTGLYAVYLNRKALEKHPDQIIKSGIAHELGHVYCDHARTPPLDDRGQIDYERAEDEADERATIWGYDPVNWISNEKPIFDAYLAEQDQTNRKP